MLIRVGVVDTKNIAAGLVKDNDNIDSEYDVGCAEIILNRNSDLQSRVPLYLDTQRRVLVIGTPKYENVEV